MLEKVIQERLKKLEIYRKFGEPYPSKTGPVVKIFEVLKKFSKLEKNKQKIPIAGRLFSWRDQGKIIFSDLVDATGKIQLIFKEDETKNFKIFKETLDVGDIFKAKGRVFVTKRGENSLIVNEGQLLTRFFIFINKIKKKDSRPGTK